MAYNLRPTERRVARERERLHQYRVNYNEEHERLVQEAFEEVASREHDNRAWGRTARWFARLWAGRLDFSKTLTIRETLAFMQAPYPDPGVIITNENRYKYWHHIPLIKVVQRSVLDGENFLHSHLLAWDDFCNTPGLSRVNLRRMRKILFQPEGRVGYEIMKVISMAYPLSRRLKLIPSRLSPVVKMLTAQELRNAVE